MYRYCHILFVLFAENNIHSSSRYSTASRPNYDLYVTTEPSQAINHLGFTDAAKLTAQHFR